MRPALFFIARAFDRRRGDVQRRNAYLSAASVSALSRLRRFRFCFDFALAAVARRHFSFVSGVRSFAEVSFLLN